MIGFDAFFITMFILAGVCIVLTVLIYACDTITRIISYRQDARYRRNRQLAEIIAASTREIIEESLQSLQKNLYNVKSLPYTGSCQQDKEPEEVNDEDAELSTEVDRE